MVHHHYLIYPTQYDRKEIITLFRYNYIIITCTSDKKLAMIRPLIQELYNFVFRVLPYGGQVKNQIEPKLGLVFTKGSYAVTKRALPTQGRTTDATSL
jgi:hypothetical protein